MEAKNEAASAAAGNLPGLEASFRPGQASEENDSMEDEDERMDDEEEQMLAKRANYGRRKSVSAEGYDPDNDDDDDEERVVHAKSDVQRQRLVQAVEKILLFNTLDSDQMSQVLDAMFERVVEPQEHIIDEGDDGDNFYIIESGVYDIIKKIEGVEKVLGQYTDKGSFGELALMYNTPRAATIVATTAGNLWAMDRQTFRKIVVKATAKKRRMYEEFLKNVDVLSTLKDDERTKVADALEQKEYADGQSIISQGDAPDYFYLVVEGSVDVRRRGDDKNDPSRELHLVTVEPGHYFGELAFLTSKPRAASCYAKGPVKCACLDVQAFERLLGPCKKLLERNMELYEQQLANITQGLSVE